MSKSTNVKDLVNRHSQHHNAKIFKMLAVCKNMPADRRREVINSHLRKRARAGKLYGVASVRRAVDIMRMNAMAEICRRNLRIGGLNDQ